MLGSTAEPSASSSDGTGQDDVTLLAVVGTYYDVPRVTVAERTLAKCGVAPGMAGDMAGVTAAPKALAVHAATGWPG